MSMKRSQTDRHFDVIVVGGGPAGMMAAGCAAKRGRRVLLIEKNKVLGKKLSITGGGRCNILNAEPDQRQLLSHFGTADKFLFSPFSQFGVPETFAFFESLGLPLVVQARQRAFPASEDARDVTATMRRFVTDNNVVLKLGVSVLELVTKQKKLIAVKTDGGEYTADSFVIATGGLSRPETGSTGEGMGWLAKLGHTVHASNPNIVPLVVKEAWVKRLSGTSVPAVKITFISTKTNKRFSRTGEILFTHFGLSSPLILNSANSVKELLTEGPVITYVDLFPRDEVGTVRKRVLAVFENNKNKTLKNVLKELVPSGMAEGVAAHLSAELLESKIHSVSKHDRERLADMLKGISLTVTGTKGLDWAVVSDGGVDLSEVDTKTMRSKVIPNLFLVGDVLHINRPSGGYSLQLCWTTGYVAGQNL